MKFCEVRIISPTPFYLDGAVIKKGACINVNQFEAEKMVEGGSATYTTRVQLTRDGVIIRNTVHAAGDVVEVNPGKALQLHNTSQGNIINPETLGDWGTPDKARKPIPPPFTPAPVLGASGPIKVKLTRSTLIGSVTYAAGVEVSVEEDRARRIVEAGVGELTAAGREALARKNPGGLFGSFPIREPA